MIISFNIFEGIKVSYKNGVSNMIPARLSSKKAYDKVMAFVDIIDAMNKEVPYTMREHLITEVVKNGDTIYVFFNDRDNG